MMQAIECYHGGLIACSPGMLVWSLPLLPQVLRGPGSPGAAAGSGTAEAHARERCREPNRGMDPGSTLFPTHIVFTPITATHSTGNPTDAGSQYRKTLITNGDRLL